MNMHTNARLISLACAGLLTLSMLAGVNALAVGEPASAQLAQAARAGQTGLAIAPAKL